MLNRVSSNALMHQMMCLVICLFLLLMDSANAVGFGRCPKYPSMPKFNMSRKTKKPYKMAKTKFWLPYFRNLFKVLGQWYEVERSFYLPEIASGCTTLEFQPLHKEEQSRFNNFKLEVAIKTINRITGNPSVNLGYATPENRKSSIMDFKFNTRFPDVIARLLPGSGKYQVLYTDYDNFAILWSCGSLGSLGYSDQIWVFGRSRDFPVEVRTKIYDALKKLSLEPDRLVLSKNKSCPKTL